MKRQIENYSGLGRWRRSYLSGVKTDGGNGKFQVSGQGYGNIIQQSNRTNK